MISITLFNVLVVVAILLFVYSLVDLNNRIYGNIISALMSSVLFRYAAVIANTGIVEDNGTVMSDLSLQIILIIPTIIIMIYTGYMIWDAYQEAQEVHDEF